MTLEREVTFVERVLLEHADASRRRTGQLRPAALNRGLRLRVVAAQPEHTARVCPMFE
ncbi:hypothetical protein [Yinghuangia aomiensis]|uniref:hypothetical protein n=1 Tax=Yinghuangia aomiensis TaxID=676205 RepID=UPI0031E61141